MSKRVAGVRGQFYPQSCSEIEQMIAHWNKILDEYLRDQAVMRATPRAIIAPHAGYVYSGFTANIAHRILANSKPKRIIVVGPSHHVAIDGVSVSEMDSYETPCGDLSIDTEYIQTLKKHFKLTFAPQAHRVEHSTETQMPFIRHYDTDAKVVELIYGRVDSHELSKLLLYILSDAHNALVISTDLSHFYTLDQANKLDAICLEGVQKQDLATLDSGCEACGKIGVKAIVEVAKQLHWGIELLDYRTSADASGDKSRVVGYMSAIVTSPKK